MVEEEADEVGEAAVEGAGDAAHQRDGVLVGGEARHCAGWGWGAVRLGLTCFCRVVGRGGGGGRRGVGEEVVEDWGIAGLGGGGEGRRRRRRPRNCGGDERKRGGA